MCSIGDSKDTTSQDTPRDGRKAQPSPLGLIVLCFIVLSRGFSPFGYTMMAMLGFFATALACHGELAQDRALNLSNQRTVSGSQFIERNGHFFEPLSHFVLSAHVLTLLR